MGNNHSNKQGKHSLGSNPMLQRIQGSEGTHLDLTDSKLSWIPMSLCNRTELESLDLSYNCITAPFPVEFTQLNHLKMLNLKNTNLTHLPEPICSMTHLEELSLEGNRFGEHYESLSNLVNLKNLNISRCQMKHFNNVTNLLSLHYLNISNNGLEELGDICKLTELKELYINENQITDLSGIGNLTELKVLNFSYNNLSWHKITEELLKCTKLEILESNSPLINIQHELHTFTKLRRLQLGCNFLGRGSSDKYIGCRFISFNENQIDISMLFPQLEATQLYDIKCKESVLNIADLHTLCELYQLEEVKYSTPWGMFTFIKNEDRWSFKIFDDNDTFDENFFKGKSIRRNAFERLSFIYGYKTIILLPEPFWGIAGVKDDNINEIEENDEDLSLKNTKVSSFYQFNNFGNWIIDIEHRLWEYRKHKESLWHLYIDIPVNRLGISFLQSELLLISEGKLLRVPKDSNNEHYEIETPNLRYYNGSHGRVGFGVTLDGSLIEVSKENNEIIVNSLKDIFSLPSMVYAISVHEYTYQIDFAIDENNSLWMREISQDKNSKNLFELCKSIENIVYITVFDKIIILVTLLGEIYGYETSSAKELITLGRINRLPYLIPTHTRKKSARK